MKRQKKKTNEKITALERKKICFFKLVIKFSQLDNN